MRTEIIKNDLRYWNLWKLRESDLKDNELTEYVKIFYIQFVLRGDLIYYQNEYNNRERLCLSKNFE